MSQISMFCCIVSADELSRLSPYNFSPALMAYGLNEHMQLTRTCPPADLHGGLLALTAPSVSLSGDFRRLCRTAVQECRLRHASGVLADWEQDSPDLRRLTQLLGQVLNQNGLSLWVPEEWGGVYDRSKVLISSALSGGTLEVRLQEALAKWGADRTVLALERVRTDLTLPCPDGQGQSLSEETLRTFIQHNRPSIYWSEEYCARYFTYRNRNQVHFVLFDDGASLVKKLELAGRLGIKTAIAPWQEISDCCGEVQKLLTAN